jgi:hypothetical protein
MNRTESDYTQRGHLLIEILRRELAEFIKEISLKETHVSLHDNCSSNKAGWTWQPDTTTA